MYKARRIACVLIAFLLLFCVFGQALTASSQVPLYVELQETHMWFDELSKYALTLVSRIMMDYKIGTYLGDYKMLSEINSMLDELSTVFVKINRVPKCSFNTKVGLGEIEKLLIDAKNSLNGLLSNVGSVKKNDDLDIQLVMSKIEEINLTMMTDLATAMKNARLDTMKIAFVTQNLRLLQITNVKSVYMNTSNPNSNSDVVKKLLESYVLDNETVQFALNKTMGKMTDPAGKKEVEKVIAIMKDIYQKADEIQKKSSQLEFSATFALTSDSVFMDILNKVDMDLRYVYENATFG